MASDRRQLWRLVEHDYKRLRQSAPEGFEPVVLVHLVGREEPVEIGFVETRDAAQGTLVRFEALNWLEFHHSRRDQLHTGRVEHEQRAGSGSASAHALRVGARRSAAGSRFCPRGVGGRAPCRARGSGRRRRSRGPSHASGARLGKGGAEGLATTEAREK
jgi:hypothetical protein